MKLLEDRILSDGKVLPGGILKVDNFLNHQIDTALLYEMARELHRLFGEEGVTKVLTIEASDRVCLRLPDGLCQKEQDEKPLRPRLQRGGRILYPRQHEHRAGIQGLYPAGRPRADRGPHGNTNTVLVSKDYILPDDRVLIVDDFLATGAALIGLRALCEQAGATVVGAGIAIEKVFQGGGDTLRAKGLRVESLAKIASMSDDGLRFC